MHCDVSPCGSLIYPVWDLEILIGAFLSFISLENFQPASLGIFLYPFCLETLIRYKIGLLTLMSRDFSPTLQYLSFCLLPYFGLR